MVMNVSVCVTACLTVRRVSQKPQSQLHRSTTVPVCPRSSAVLRRSVSLPSGTEREGVSAQFLNAGNTVTL